jgi:hypothetical protein
MSRSASVSEPSGIRVARDAAGADKAAAEPAAAQLQRQVQDIAAQPAAMGRRRQKPDIAGQRAEIADVVGDAFELQRDRPQRQGPPRAFNIGEPLQHLAIGDCMADRRVAGDGLGEMDGVLMGPAAQRLLDAAVLVAERDFEMQHALAVAAEAEMPRLDDAGMHRPDRDLVDLLAADPEEIDAADLGPARRETDRLQPRMALRFDAPLLENLALEIMGRREIRRQRRVGGADVAAAQTDFTAPIVSQRGKQTDAVSLPPEPAEEQQAAAGGDRIDHGASEGIDAEHRHGRQGQRRRIAGNG